MATSDFLNSAAKANTKAILLLEIDLIGTGTTYDSSKTIYLSSDYITIESVLYEGIVLDFGGFDESLEANEGLASINDFSITLANKRLQFFEADTKFSDIFDDYYFSGSVCRVYQWFQDLTAKSDAELRFTGIAKQPTFNISEVSFNIEEDTSVFIDTPTTIISLNDFAQAPNISIGKSLPIIYGNSWFFNFNKNENSSVSPCIETDENNKTFYISNHQLKHSIFSLVARDVVMFLDDVNLYGAIRATNVSFINDDDGARFTLGDNIQYDLNINPRIKGTQYTAADTNYYKILGGSNDVLSMAASELLYLKIDRVPSKGVLEIDSSFAITLEVDIENVAGSSPYGVVKYYNPNWNGAGTGFSTGTNITGNGTVSYSIESDRSKKGIRSDNADQNDIWTWQDLESFEFGVDCNAGDSFDISNIRLLIERISLTYITTKNSSNRITYLGTKKWKRHEGFIKNIGLEINNDNVSNIFFNFDSRSEGAKKFGSWIDADSRNNGYNENDAIISPAYIIESILRDVMAIPTTFIDFASFDIAGNTTDGILDGWEFSGGIYETINSRELLENLLLQCKSQLYRDPDGKFSLIVYNSSASVDYSNYKFDKNNNIANLEISQTSYDDIISQVKINYALDRGNGDFRKTAFIESVKNSSGTFLNGAITNNTAIFTVDDATVFTKEDKPAAITAALAGAGAGNLSNGGYQYKVTLVASDGETEPSNATATLTVVDNSTDGQASLTNIPTGSARTTARKIYRTEVDDIFTFKLLTTINDNTTTTYTDNTADGSLGATVNDKNTTYLPLIMTDREVNKIEGVDVDNNQIHLENTVAVRDQYRNSKIADHTDNSPIFIITEDSDDGDGSTADTTREGEATEAIWKYDAKNKIEIDADWIITTATAVNLRDYYHDYYNVPHWIVEFDTFLRASDLRVGHIFEFDDSVMDSFLKVGGASWSGKKFRCQAINRTGSMTYRVVGVEI